VAKIVFNIVIETKMDVLFCMYYHCDNEIANSATDGKVLTMSVREAHDKLGHGDEPSTRKAHPVTSILRQLSTESDTIPRLVVAKNTLPNEVQRSLKKAIIGNNQELDGHLCYEDI
jgi:hypothetical protein